MRFGVFASFLFHLAIVGAAFLSLPLGNWRPDVEAEPYIPLELIAEAELDLTTSVPAAAPEVVEEPEPEPDLPEEAETIEEPPAPTEPDPVMEEPEEQIVVEKTPDPTPEEPKETPKPKPPEPKKTAELNFDDLIKVIDKERDDERAEQPRETPSEVTETAEKARAAIGAGDRLTASDKAKMRAAVERCWNASAIIGAPEPEKLVVVIDIELNRDGSLVAAPKVANALQINLSGNRFWKVAEQSALRAVVSCAPYDFFPTDRYQDWKAFKLNFDPSEMVGR